MNKIKKALFIFLCIILVNSISAQNTGTLRGLVIDSTNSEALAYGNVFIKELGIGAATDVRGYFLIPSIPADKNFTLIVSYIGYHTKVLTVKVAKNKITHYDIRLVPSAIELQAIEKIGELIPEENVTDLSLKKLLARDIEMLPKGVETDLFRSLKYLTGVQSTSDVSAKFYVRGGASNQNLILFDGIAIYNPFHALGLFSVIDPDIINSVEFYKGGFSANYGSRLSSVINVITKDGNKNRFSAKASASYLSTKLLLEGPLPHGSFYLSGRKSYSTQILKKFLNDQNVPADFYDFSFKANYSNPDFITGSKFTFNGFFSKDKINNPDPRVEDFLWQNNLFGFKWFHVGDSPLFVELGLSLSSFKGEVIPKLSDVSRSNNKVDDISLKMDFTYMFSSKDEIGIGFHINQINTKLFIEIINNWNTDINANGTDIAFYTKYKLLRWDFIGIDAGIRFNLATLSQNEHYKFFEPRFSFTLNPAKYFSIKGAWGIYQQTVTTISDEDEVINIYEPWIISPSYLVPATAEHYILGIDLYPFGFLDFGFETYYKLINNLPLLNKNKIFQTDPDFISGKGESYGIELTSKIKTDLFNFTAAYTHAYAYKELDGKRYYPRYDVRHSVNLILDINLGRNWSSSVVWVYSSGLPFTQILGFYDKLYLDNFFIPWNQLDPRKPYTLIGIQNLGRLPDYHRLDMTLSKKLSIAFVNLFFDFSIINVYNRANIFYFKRETGERVNMLPFLPTATVKVEL